MLKISTMSGKLVGIPALNTDTTSNPFCFKMHNTKGTICERCYSWAMLETYRKNCVPAFRHNGEVLNGVMPSEWIPETKPGPFRINAHGEFLSYQHLVNVMRMVLVNPQTFFGVWTKRKDLIRVWLQVHEKPKNCNFIYSNPIVDSRIKVPEGFDKVFNVQSKDNRRVNCRGACIECMTCYAKTRTRQIYEVEK